MSHWMYDGLFKLAETAGDNIIYEELQLTKDQVVLSKILHNALIQTCEGPAGRMVRRQEENTNGVETWRRLYNRFNASTRSRATGRITTQFIQFIFKLGISTIARCRGHCSYTTIC